MLSGRSSSERTTIVLGLVLVVIGGVALLGRALAIDLLGLGWPIFVLLPGVLLFAGGLGVGGKSGLGLAIPGGIIAMVGVVLSFQAATGLWATWAYAWALVAPGGVGLAMVLYGMLTRQGDVVRAGTPVLLIGLGMFTGFGLFFEGVLHLSGASFSIAEPLLAAALVVLGAGMLLAGALRSRGSHP